jgi:hypothetical protein
MMVADRSVQLPTGSAIITSELPATYFIASENPGKLQQKQLPLTSFTGSAVSDKNAVSTNAEA